MASLARRTVEANGFTGRAGVMSMEVTAKGAARIGAGLLTLTGCAPLPSPTSNDYRVIYRWKRLSIPIHAKEASTSSRWSISSPVL